MAEQHAETDEDDDELGDDELLPPLPYVEPLSDADRDQFIATLENPPPPTDSLKRALAAAQGHPHSGR